MPKVHVFSLKVGSSHGLWQYKVSGTHDRVVMHGLRQILDQTCQLLGYDTAERSVIYLFHFSAEPFEGYQVCLERMKEGSDGGCYYRVIQSSLSDFVEKALFPSVVNTDYLHAWPERIYFRFEKSLVGGIVN